MRAVDNARMAKLIDDMRTAFATLDDRGIYVHEIHLQGSIPLICIEDPAEKIRDSRSIAVTRGNGSNHRETVKTMLFERVRLQWPTGQ